LCGCLTHRRAAVSNKDYGALSLLAPINLREDGHSKMRRVYILFLVLLSSTAVRAQTPTLVQYANDSMQNNAAVHFWSKKLPNPAQAGNLLVMACTWGSSTATASVTDDKSNTWTAGPVAQYGAGNQSLQIFYASNVAASTQVITMTLNSSAAFVQCTPHEYFNVSTAANPTDGSSAAVINTGTNLAAGNLTTTTAGDLIFYAGMCRNCGNPGNPLTWTAGSGFTPTVADGTSFFGAEYQVQSSMGSINPAMALNSPTSGGMAAAIAFKSASAGSGPAAGIHVNSAQVLTYPLSTNWTGTSITLQIPTSGNLIVIATESLTGANVTNISSIPANAWNNSAGCANNSSNAMSVCIWYAANATPSAEMTITLTYSEYPVVGPIDGFWDISGAASSPFDVAATATGNFGQQTGTVSAPALTPTTSNGVVIGLIEQDSQTVGSATPGSLQTVQTDGYQYLGLDQDGGWLNYYNPDTSTINIKWTFINTEGAYNVGNWEAIAAAFKAGQDVPQIAIPAITNLSPSSGIVGTSVTITGTNFGATQGSSTVTFNGKPATPSSWSNTNIVAPVPSGAATGNVVVNVAGSASNAVVFSVSSLPSITNLSPSSGTVGSSVTITGANFGATQASSSVTFNGKPATPSSWSNTNIVAPVPSGAATGNVVVNVAGSASNALVFTVTSAPSNPVAPGHLQQASNSDISGASYTSFSATFGASNSTGNAIIIGVTYGNVNPVITATDSQGNTYLQAINTYDPRHNQGSAILYALNIAGGSSNKVTVHFTSSVAYLALGIHEYTGIASSSALDVTSGKTGSGTSLSSGSAVTTASGDLIFGCGVEDSTGNGDTFTAGSGFTTRVNLGAAAAYADEDAIQATPGAMSVTSRLSSSRRDWIANMAAFKAAH
jgi:IPT/TIG domain